MPMVISPSRDTWQFINGFAAWLSALGTVAAVIVALVLARRDRGARLRINAGERLLLTVGEKAGTAPRYFYISAVNLGAREVVVSGITWQVGYFRKTKMIQIPPEPPLGSALPARLKLGEDVKFMVPREDFHREIASVRNIVSRSRLPRLAARSIRVGVYLSTGEEALERLDAETRQFVLSNRPSDPKQ
ncbi:MAG: hypothetical protein M3Z54_07610 [Gemmatimonadota bacterium]|nr:hypothetical protein [Gemmatimonadota bacterium]